VHACSMQQAFAQENAARAFTLTSHFKKHIKDERRKCPSGLEDVAELVRAATAAHALYAHVGTSCRARARESRPIEGVVPSGILRGRVQADGGGPAPAAARGAAAHLEAR